MKPAKIVRAFYNDDDSFNCLLLRLLKRTNIILEEVYTPFPVHGLDKAIRT